jgi:hypothetical protein
LTGRGLLLHLAIDGPQIAAIFLVLAGALTLRESKNALRERNAAPDAESQPATASENRGAA